MRAGPLRQVLEPLCGERHAAGSDVETRFRRCRDRARPSDHAVCSLIGGPCGVSVHRVYEPTKRATQDPFCLRVGQQLKRERRAKFELCQRDIDLRGIIQPVSQLRAKGWIVERRTVLQVLEANLDVLPG